MARNPPCSPFSIFHFSVVCALLVAASFCAAAGGIDYTNPPQGLFYDEWAVIRINGQQCGYTHTTLTRQGDTVKSTVLDTFVIKRAGQGSEMTQLMTFDETVDGRPLAFTTVSEMALKKVRQQGVVRDGNVTVRSEQYGNAITETFEYPPRALMTWAQLRLAHDKGYAPGTEYEIAAYLPIVATNQALTMKVKIENEEEIEIGGKKHKAIRSTQELTRPGMSAGMVFTVWVDPRNESMLKSVVLMMGTTMEMESCTREQAMADFEAPEAFMTTLVKLDKPIDREAVRRIKMKLTLEGEGGDMPRLPKTGMQTPSQATGRSVILDIARQDHAALAEAQPAVKTNRQAYAEFLEPNIFINSHDPAVKKMADDAAGETKAPYQVADRLRRYVSEKIEDKNLNIGFATASEVCRNKAGDCSEHAVLLAALARAKGIPSRVACGLVYMPWFKGADDVLGFHMWTQVFVNGQWIDLDAAQNESDCNPTHIALAVDSLRDAGLGDLAFAIFPVMSRLKIELLETEPLPAAE